MRGTIGVVVAATVLMALAACDTQPATDVTQDAATLNAKGACGAGTSGTWEYQIKEGVATEGWQRVGPAHGFSCAQNTGEVAFTQERASYLKPSTWYQFRLVSRLSNGTVQTWDADGTQGGQNFDSFTTGPIIEEEGPVTDVDVPTDDPVASAAGCKTREFKNPRVGRSWPFRTTLWTLTLRTRRTFCPTGPYAGQVRKMFPAVTECSMTSAGAAAGYGCEKYPESEGGGEAKKIRAISLGGNPEHVVWTYSWRVVGKDPVLGKTFYTKTWCASNFASGTGAIATNGRCDLVTPEWRFP